MNGLTSAAREASTIDDHPAAGTSTSTIDFPPDGQEELRASLRL
jgi:hypothetical protein